MTLDFAPVLRQSPACWRVYLLGAAILIGVSIQSADSQERTAVETAGEPYVVFVASEAAYARCGPSGDFYRTDPLRHGQELEVYVETADGWLGIRPPEDSFSWLPAETVDVNSSGDEGTITEDRTVSWIGTHLGRARRYRWQVQLAEGEAITLLGKSEREGPDGPQLWYRIVPPAGEFRWIHRDQVVATSEELVAAAAPPDDEEIEFFPATRTARDSRGAQDSRAESIAQMEYAPHPEPLVPGRIQSTRPHSVTASPLAPGFAGERDGVRGFPERHSAEPRELNGPLELGGAPALDQPVIAEAAIGSGLRDLIGSVAGTLGGDVSTSARRSQPSPKLVDANSAEFVTRPRLQDIGSGGYAPRSVETASDRNWVVGSDRVASLTPSATARALAPVSYQSESLGAPPAAYPLANHSGLNPGPAPLLRQLRTISAESLARIDRDANGADVDTLQLMLSRLMAAGATSAEVDPLLRRTYELTAASANETAAGRARLLGERVEQYQRIARRRDGDIVIESSAATVAPTIPSPDVMPVSANDEAATGLTDAASRSRVTSVATADSADNNDAGPEDAAVSDEVTEVGTLVQVFSARKNTPPYALTDQTGRTIAYVTPAPGIDLRPHLNSRVELVGRVQLLPGVDLPHFSVQQARRAGH